MSRVAHLAFWLMTLLLTSLPVGVHGAEEKRVALVVGNGAYTDLGRLLNPVNDMQLMVQTLRRLGFDVMELADADQAAMKRAIQDFGRRLEDAGRDAVGLFYYAGHGVQINGTNYLIPIKSNIAREPDVEIEAVKLDWVLAQMEHARNRLNILILDACRNNPLSRSFRSSEQGLSRIDAPRGTLIAYATAPGSVSFDGEGANSPYTAALAETIDEPGLVAESAFRTVRVKVMEATGGRQVPWESSSLTGPFYFSGLSDPEEGEDASEVALADLPPPDREAPAESGRATERPALPGDTRAEMLFWEGIEDSDSPELYQAYLDRFPDGIFAAIARQRLAAATDPGAAASDDERPPASPPTAVPAPKPAPPEEEEQAALAPAVVQPPRPLDASSLAGRWEGRFRCQQDVVGMALQIRPLAGGSVEATFEFFPTGDGPSFPMGSFRATGVFEREARRLRLEAGDWIERPWGFQRHDLVGVVGDDGASMEGRILTTGCSEFVVGRLAGRS